MGNTCCSPRRKHEPETLEKITGKSTKNNTRLYVPEPTQPLTLKNHPENGYRPRIVKALYSYKARSDVDISFSKGDQMEVITSDDVDWWTVLHLKTKIRGLVPVNYIADDATVYCEDWFFPNTSRKEAEHLLLAAQNTRGTYLVRPAEHAKDSFSLSVKDWEEAKGYHVKHYKIRRIESGFYIAANQVFPTLSQLVISYTKNALGLCHVLARPCPKPEPQMWDLGPSLRDNWEIPRNEIRLIRKLGHGNFGEVYYGKWQNNTEVAVKTLREGKMSKQAFLEEARIMKNLRHKHLVALYAVCSEHDPVYIVQEYMSKGSLLEYLRNGEGRYLKFEYLIFIAAQVASGMAYLESKLLIHRDLAARNVLIGENKMAKICDFGLARIIEDKVYCPTQASAFPVRWTAPEAILYGRFSIKSDVWSYGILLMELFTKGQVPYCGMQGSEVVERVRSGYRLPKPVDHHLPNDVYLLMLSCWDYIPDNRPTFEYLNHYFESFTVTSELPYREIDD